MSCTGWIRTHSLRQIIKEQFAKHLPEGTIENVDERRPRWGLVRVKYRLERDAETDNKYGQHEHELDEFRQLQQQNHHILFNNFTITKLSQFSQPEI